MTANPDALRRAADEMDALINRQAAHLREIDRLNEGLRERAGKIHEVRTELGRAGFPVDEGAWPTDQLRALIADRADLARRLEQAEDERDALRPKPTGPVWDKFSLIINDKTVASVGESLARPGVWLVSGFGVPSGEATSEESARKLAELLAGHDPGGFWTVVGHTVPVDVVRAVCGSVAVGWEAA